MNKYELHLTELIEEAIKTEKEVIVNDNFFIKVSSGVVGKEVDFIYFHKRKPFVIYYYKGSSSLNIVNWSNDSKLPKATETLQLIKDAVQEYEYFNMLKRRGLCSND